MNAFKNNWFIISFLFSFIFSCSIFVYAKSPEEVRLDLLSFRSDILLKSYLLENDLVPISGDTSLFLPAGKINVDIFRQNLFDDEINEVVLQIRSDYGIFINVYYQINNEWSKVPGQMGGYFFQGIGYNEQGLLFYFENIFAEDEFTIITKSTYGYNRYYEEKVNIYRIYFDAIKKLNEFSIKSSSYSGVLVYMYNYETEYYFKLVNNGYPKELFRTTRYWNENEMRHSDGGYVIEGKIERGEYTERVSFNKDTAKVERINETKVFFQYINRLEELYKIKSKGCDGIHQFFISDMLLKSYIDTTFQKEIDKLPFQFIDTNDYIKFLKICEVSILNRTLSFSYKDSSGLIQKKRYNLRPPIASLLRPDIIPNRLYYFDQGYKNYYEKIIYFNKDTLISFLNNTNQFNFGDTLITFQIETEIRSEARIIFFDGFRYFAIPIKNLVPYLKLEILKILKND